ncbi:ATP-binding cassette domain-containing protein [Sulfurimonas aquatica]|uniref:ATP-binding cassette domain-containing protein n=1 Tax=Sulfurimonas aquatica TaxID=2672570 RepID=A0A975GC53_9BACT|nr:ABC transporter ATP-binding protein [Sulfurimonas aquatica]QSZ40928.1 ATP-binding cassette domain-containing protein [Sulfurimonas aquatica]
MSNTAIKVNHLTKVYKLYNKPIDRLKESLHPLKKQYHKDFYALNDVSFEIKKGETVGIIGKNGAGKSTLLKIITGVLTPSSGHVYVNGRIASLLELGAGFNPEYTGIENIYLQGTLMGYMHDEMESKLEAILDFADIGDFVYQPVKSYSSGMFARLAFAVAINVDPDILIVDEALSVGDAAFQNKCIRKMEEIGEKGITILFVSHDTQTINKFCSKVVWLNNGTIKEQGKPEFILENYMSFMSYGIETQRNENTAEKEIVRLDSSQLNLKNISTLDSFGEKKALIESIGFFDENNISITNLKQATQVKFICEFATSIDLHNVGIGVLLKDTLNNEILTFNSYMYSSPLKYVKKETRTRVIIEFKVPKLNPKEYLVTVALSEGTQLNHIQQHWIHSATTINIISCDFVDTCIFSLYPKEIEYKYEQI